MKGIKIIYDNEGMSIDRYTVYFTHPKDWGIIQPGLYPYVAMSGAPFHPQGFCQHGEGFLGKHNGKRIKFENLPEDCQRAARRDLE
jgi:hypothetical protein